MDHDANAAIPAASGDRDPRHVLTTRECEVLDMLAAGIRTEQIAAKLFISTTTVRNHVERILHKLGVHTRLEAVILWMSREEAPGPASRPREPHPTPDSRPTIQPPE